jgi:hypothetical protein
MQAKRLERKYLPEFIGKKMPPRWGFGDLFRYAFFYHNTALTGLIPNLNPMLFFLHNPFIAGKMIYWGQASERRYFGSRNILFGCESPVRAIFY